MTVVGRVGYILWAKTFLRKNNFERKFQVFMDNKHEDIVMTTVYLESFHVDLELNEKEIQGMIDCFKREYNLDCKIIDDETISLIGSKTDIEKYYDENSGMNELEIHPNNL